MTPPKQPVGNCAVILVITVRQYRQVSRPIHFAPCWASLYRCPNRLWTLRSIRLQKKPPARPLGCHPLESAAHRCVTGEAVLYLDIRLVVEPISRRRRESPASKVHSSQPASREFPFSILRMIRLSLKHSAKFTFRCFRAKNRRRDLRAGDESSPDGGVCVVTEHLQVPPGPLSLSQVAEEKGSRSSPQMEIRNANCRVSM